LLDESRDAVPKTASDLFREQLPSPARLGLLARGP